VFEIYYVDLEAEEKRQSRWLPRLCSRTYGEKIMQTFTIRVHCGYCAGGWEDHEFDAETVDKALEQAEEMAQDMFAPSVELIEDDDD
jgi:hypothetical protein